MIDNEHEDRWREQEVARAYRHLRKQEALWNRISGSNIVASLYGTAFFVYASSELFSSWFNTSLKFVGTGLLLCGVVVNVVSARRLGRDLDAIEEEVIEGSRNLRERYGE